MLTHTSRHSCGFLFLRQHQILVLTKIWEQISERKLVTIEGSRQVGDSFHLAIFPYQDVPDLISNSHGYRNKSKFENTCLFIQSKQGAKLQPTKPTSPPKPIQSNYLPPPEPPYTYLLLSTYHFVSVSSPGFGFLSLQTPLFLRPCLTPPVGDEPNLLRHLRLHGHHLRVAEVLLEGHRLNDPTMHLAAVKRIEDGPTPFSSCFVCLPGVLFCWVFFGELFFRPSLQNLPVVFP